MRAADYCKTARAGPASKGQTIRPKVNDPMRGATHEKYRPHITLSSASNRNNVPEK